MPRRTSGQASTLRDHYRAAARKGDWALYKTLAERLWDLGGDGAEVQYALAYALERLGQVEEARRLYRVVLRLDSRHERARARLRALGAQG
jgi:Flp pilus assembly protein TadD